MRNNYFPFILLFIASGCQQQPAKTSLKPGYDYCYILNDSARLFSSDSQETRTILLTGTDPVLSPDGSWIAYTDTTTHDERSIRLFEIATGKTTNLDTACRECFGPVWSPDGGHIAYSFYSKTWDIRYADRANGLVHLLANSADTLEGIYSPTWTEDGKNIIAQDMSYVYIIRLDGVIIKKIALKEIDTALMITSDSRFLLTKDGGRLIYDSGVDEGPEGDEPPNAIFSYDLAVKTKRRLSPKGWDCWHPVMKDSLIYVNAVKINDSSFDIYSMNLEGGNFKKVIHGAGISLRSR